METDDMAALGKPGTKLPTLLAQVLQPTTSCTLLSASPVQKASKITSPWHQRDSFPSDPLVPPLPAYYLLETTIFLGPLWQPAPAAHVKGPQSTAPNSNIGINSLALFQGREKKKSAPG